MFKGNARFALLRQLGTGGMGVVYEALDRQRDTRVALKTLRDTDADHLYRLKREFRSLRDLTHRNLIALDELFEEDGHWFFTMELLHGEDLRTYLQRGAADAGAADAAPAPGPPPNALDETLPRHLAEQTLGTSATRGPQATDFARVRDIFAQVADGLLAIHEAGKIHRDIKPPNIVVTRDARAVILDFGLVTEQWGKTRSGEGEIVGTLMYMAPEQAAAQSVGVAADWYSVGVMLYEVLTGQRPYTSPWGVVLAAKQQIAPPDPRELCPACPQDLAELCGQLLQLDPLQRPPGTDVWRRLSRPGRPSEPRLASEPGLAARPAAAAAAASTSASTSTSARASAPAPVSALAPRVPSAPQQRVFVGREGELRALRRAFDDVTGTGGGATATGAPITVFVHGESGIGKSTLIQHFVSDLEHADDRTVVLTGQCREHEAVPFKAMDGVIDALSRHVCRLSDVAAAELVPRNAALLPAVFPVLGRIPAIAKAPRVLHAAGDPFQQRKRVFTALREMLNLLSERCRLICVIDDMQWADGDSLHLLEELLRPPEPPRLLLLASVRSGEPAPALPQLPGEVRTVHLRRLDPEESVQLAGMLLERLAPEQRDQTARIVEETGGHPLFIGEIVRHAASEPRAGVRPLRLDEAIWARVSQLDATSWTVLELLAVAVAPLSEEVVRTAAKLDAGSFQRCITSLRASHLVRSASPTRASFEIYHDRVRQAVVHHLGDAERVALNDRIALALETSGAHVPPELLIHHLQGAGQLEQAAQKALEAADRAQAALAFDRAGQLYETALGLAPWPEAGRREILVKLGGALASAGRGPDAAAAYAKAAEGADPMTQLSCRIQVADQLLRSGNIERGSELLFSLFREHGHDLPRSTFQITFRIIRDRARLALRGLRWTDRHRSEIAPRDLAILALYKAASRGQIMIDPVRAVYFVGRGLRLAMALGARDSVLDFLLLESGFRAGEGAGKQTAFLAAADRLMREHPDPQFQSVYRQTLGMRAYLAVDRQYQEAFETLDRSDDVLAQMADVAWELSALRYFLICSLLKLGDLARLRAYSERFVRDAEQRGNAYLRTTIRRACNLLWLVDDDPAGARAALQADSWISHAHGYHLQHWMELRARVEIAIYEGSSIDEDFYAEHLAGLARSSLQKILEFRCETAWLVGRMALAEARRDPAQRRIARRSAAKLRSYGTHYCRMLATLLHATLAVQDGELSRAAASFREVVTLGEAAHTALLTAAARRQLGALVGGDEGRALVAAADQWMREVGIKDPARMTYLVSPCEIELGERGLGERGPGGRA